MSEKATDEMIVKLFKAGFSCETIANYYNINIHRVYEAIRARLREQVREAHE